MATSVLLACGLNEQRLQPYTHLSEESGVDGGFLISSILGQRIRVPNAGTILICLHQTFSHYCSAGIRLGYNLQMSLGKNLRVIDILNDIAGDFGKSKWTTTTGNFLQLLWDEIQTQSMELFAAKSTITVIIDDLSVLLNLGASPGEIMRFANRLRQWSEGRNADVAIVTKLNTCEAFGTLMNQIGELCDIHVVIERLKSGNFKEVDGKIVVKKDTCSAPFDFQEGEKTILYKVLERNIKIFNPGEVGIKV